MTIDVDDEALFEQTTAETTDIPTNDPPQWRVFYWADVTAIT
jgi:hypothetical protein